MDFHADKFDMNLEIMDFWIRTNKLIKERKITQEYLCNECNINLSTYGGWNLRGVYPNAKQIIDIAKLLETTPEYLVYGKESEIPDDIKKVESLLLQFSESEREPIITMLEGQINYWKKILNKQ